MKLIDNHKLLWIDKRFIINVLFGLILLIGSLFVNNYAQLYSASHASNSVNDIFLDNLPVVDVHLIYSEGAVLFLVVLAFVVLYEPKYLPFGLKAFAFFYITRSFFMVLTHLAPPVHAIFINPTDYIQRLSDGDDLFFSAHTGLPFLFMFVFWHKKFWRYFFLLCTVVGGTAVLLGHLHYSIDVFSALFISFGVFSICKELFPKDYKLTQ